MIFTEADAKKLAELQAKQKQAKQEERNKAKRDDRACKALFGMSVKEVQARLDGTHSTDNNDNYWYEEWKRQKDLIDRLMVHVNGTDNFEDYVRWREQQAEQN